MNRASDVLIIGGGVIGASAAYYLAKGGASVTVLEKSGVIGNGGSSRNGGGVRQSGRDPRELPLAIYGVRNLWPSLSDELGMDVEYYQHGNLRLGKTEQHLNILQGLTDRAASCGLDVRMANRAEVKSICPYLSDEVAGASWCPTDGHANPLLATLAFYRAARGLGARFISGLEVKSIQKVHGRARRVVTDEGDYEADTIILAAGFDSRALAATVGIDVPMHRALMETLVTEMMPPMFYQMLGTAAADFYGHQSKHGSFVFGGCTGVEEFARDNGTPTGTASSAPITCRGIMRYFPMLADAKIVRTWAGWADICIDRVPVIDRVDEVPGLILACGFSGHGFGISPAVGLTLSELARGEQTTIDISKLNYDRFGAAL